MGALARQENKEWNDVMNGKANHSGKHLKRGNLEGDIWRANIHKTSARPARRNTHRNEAYEENVIGAAEIGERRLQTSSGRKSKRRASAA